MPQSGPGILHSHAQRRLTFKRLEVSIEHHFG